MKNNTLLYSKTRNACIIRDSVFLGMLKNNESYLMYSAITIKTSHESIKQILKNKVASFDNDTKLPLVVAINGVGINAIPFVLDIVSSLTDSDVAPEHQNILFLISFDNLTSMDSLPASIVEEIKELFPTIVGLNDEDNHKDIIASMKGEDNGN